MTEPPSRTPPDEPEETPTPGIAEEIREEIAEVVEHVPRPVRWTVAKITWVVVAGVIGLLALLAVSVGLYLANRTEWVAEELSLFLNQALARRSDVAAEIRDLKGNLLGGMTLVEPRLRFRDGRLPPLFEARRVDVSYSLWSLLGGRPHAIEVRIEEPVLRLSRGPDGRVRLPKWKAGPAGKGGRPLDVLVAFRHGRVLLPEGMEGIEGLEAEIGYHSRGTTRIEVGRLSFEKGPYGTRLDRLRGGFESAPDSMRLVLQQLSGPALELSGRAAWSTHGGDRIAHLEVRRLQWGLLARLFDNASLDVPGEASMTLDARGEKQWRSTFSTSLTWDGLPFNGTGRALWDAGRLRIEPLDATSRAGRLHGWVTYAKQGWAIGGDVDRGDPSTWGPLRIPGWPAGSLHGRFRYAQDTRIKGRPDSRLDALLGGSTLAGWQVDSARVAVAFPYRQPVRFGVSALRRGGRFDLAAATDPKGWSGTYAVRDLPLEEWPDGRASGMRGMLRNGSGTVHADADGLWVDGTLDGTGSTWLGLSTARWRLEDVSGRLLPTPALSARGRLSDLVDLGVHFDSAAVAFALGDRIVALDRIQAWAADTLVTADGRARWDTAGWSLELDHAGMRSRQFDWAADPPVRLSGDPHGVSFDRLQGHDGESRVEIAGRWAAPGGAYDWTLEGHALELGRLGLPPEWGLAGHADVRLDVHGVSGDPRWTFTADCSRPSAQHHGADSLHVVLAGAPSRAELREGMLTLGGGRIAGALRVEDAARPWPDTLTFDGVTRWLARAARCDGSFHADALPAGRLRAYVPEANGISGALTGTLRVQGSPSRPDLTLDATLASPRWRDFEAEAVHAAAAYRDGRLTVGEVKMAHQNLTSTITGSMPLHLALGERPEIPEQPMSWRVEVPSGDLGVVPLFVPQIASARGHIEGWCTLQGTARHPRLEGVARVGDGAVRLEGREEVLDHLSATLRLSETRITLDSLRAREGARGIVAASGGVDLTGLKLKGYRFDLRLRDFTAVEQGLYAAAFDGDFVVTNGPRVHGQTLPRVNGTVQLDRAAVLFDFANQTEVQRLAATTMPLFWVYRVQVEASDNLHWQPPNGDIEFSADLTVEQSTDSLIVFGDMNALRGTYWFLSNRFQVDRADLTFDNVNGVDPLLDVSATTRIVSQAQADPSAGSMLVGNPETGPVTHVVTATIQGRSSKPTIAFSDDQAAWDEPRILRELTLGTLAGPRGIGDPLDNYVTRALNRTLSASMSQIFRGYVDEWALERQRGGLFGGQGDVVASVGVPVTKNVSVRVKSRVPGTETQRVTGTPDDLFDRNIEAEYRLNRFFFVTTEYVQRRPGANTTTQGTQDFNVNLKARWEY